ncbi:hypothetical protein [Streptomyces virginiae]|uniref:hypothetical protein n=1 Tax=Streptomyces virginiae TaxID=1961 RepID=UPI00369F551F
MTPPPPGVTGQARPHDGLPPGSVRHPDAPHPDLLPVGAPGAARRTPGSGARTAAPGQRTLRQQPATRSMELDRRGAEQQGVA